MVGILSFLIHCIVCLIKRYFSTGPQWEGMYAACCQEYLSELTNVETLRGPALRHNHRLSK